MPTGAKSSTPKPGMSWPRRMPLTMMLVVVKRVAMPPKIVAKASGMSSRAGLIRFRRARPDMAGNRMAAAAMLFMTRDRVAPASMMTITSRLSLVPPTRSRSRPAWSVIPVTRNASVRMKIDTIVTTAELAKPENASRGERMPVTPRATTTRSATRSARRRSLRSKTMATRVIASVMTSWGAMAGQMSPLISILRIGCESIRAETIMSDYCTMKRNNPVVSCQTIVARRAVWPRVAHSLMQWTGGEQPEVA